MIATPCGDGKYERLFTIALCKTARLLDHLGVKFEFIDMPYNSDLPLARLKLFGYFYRNDYTHLMMIDSDMGWEPSDVVRLLVADRDFIGGVGCKKKYPIEFAFSNLEDNSRELGMLTFEAGTQITEITEVGMAFILISKSCADKMVGAYGDLSFPGDSGITEYDVFAPIVKDGRRLSEDFAFCRRWRDIGGKIYLLPDIRMTHTGSHTFSGMLMEHLSFGEKDNEETAAE